MTQTLTLGSTLPYAVALPFGLTVHGANHPDAQRGIGVTPDVDAEAYHAWVSANPDFVPVSSGSIFVLDQNLAELPETPHGHEPELDHVVAAEGDALTQGVPDAAEVVAPDPLPTFVDTDAAYPVPRSETQVQSGDLAPVVSATV